MKTTTKRICIIACIGAGVVLLGISYYINQQVLGGKEQISSAEEKVNTGKTLFGLTPVTKQLSDRASQSADRKIAHGKEEIAYYETLASILQVAGIICIALGIGCFFIRKSAR